MSDKPSAVSELMSWRTYRCAGVDHELVKRSDALRLAKELDQLRAELADCKRGSQMSNGTGSGIGLAVPTASGIKDAMAALREAHEAGQWILIAPDGRLGQNADAMILFAVLAATLQGDPLRFGEI